MIVIKKSLSESGRTEIIVIKFSNFTEFALKSKEFLQMVSERFEKLNSKNYVELGSEICNEISLLAKEKLGSVSTLLIETSCSLNVYNHIYTHGKENSHICEKFIIMGSDSIWPRPSCIKAAMILMGVPYLNMRNSNFSMKTTGSFFETPKTKSKTRSLKVFSKQRVSLTSKAISKPISFCIVC